MGRFFHLIMRSMKRRKKEIRYVSAVTFIAVFFLGAVSVFQNVMNSYVTEVNYQNYGEWVLSAVEDLRRPGDFQEIEHPYLSGYGVCMSGGEILNAAGEVSGIRLGSLDKSCVEIGNISLFEGRMPEKEGEIVMDLPSLAALGYSYDLGQTVSLAAVIWPGQEETGVTASAEPVIYRKEFVLVGTVECIAGNWVYCEGYSLPDCFVTKADLESMGGSLFNTYFYQLDRKYEDIDAVGFGLSLAEKYQYCTFNSYSYGGTLWGSPEMFTAVKVVLTVTAGLAVAYLVNSYEGERRKWYYQYRMIGAEKSQIREMIFLEGAYAVFPLALAAFILPQIAGALLCLVFAKSRGIPYFYEFRPAEFFTQAAVIFAVLILALLTAWIRSSDRSLAKNTLEITERKRRRLRQCRAGDLVKSFFARQRKRYPFRQTAAVLFSVAVCTVCIMIFSEIFSSIKAYRWDREFLDDFTASKTLEYTYEWGSEEGGITEAERRDFTICMKGLTPRQKRN